MKPIFKTENRFTLVDRVIKQIREAISSGRLKPGDRLVEKDIAQGMQIGRNAVREAFRYMAKEGVVTITPFKGAHVTLHSKKEIQQMFEVMGGLEGMCARLAAQKMSQENLKELESLHTDLETYYKKKDPEKYLKTNWAFHGLIQKFAKNDVLDQVVNELRQKIFLYRKKQLFQPNRFRASMDEHRLIIKAFQEKNPTEVEQRMRQHLFRQEKSLMEEDIKECHVNHSD
jgi:DNA-binding GntR family transcriptional regulator